MRVLSIGFMYPPHDLGGGYELTWRSAVRSMRDRGDEVTVVASDWRRPGLPPSQELDEGVHRELRTYWHDHAFPRLGPRARLRIERCNAEVLDRHLREARPDVVNWWAMGGMSLSLVERVRRSGLPAVGVVGDDWLSWGPRADAWVRPFRKHPRLASAAESLTGIPARVDLRSAALWLFNSAHMKESALVATPGLRRAEVVHPGIDDGMFRPADPHPWGWRMLYLGRMDPRKGVHIAVEAMRHLPEVATLTVQGGGDDAYAKDVRDQAARLGLGRRVAFTQEPRERLPAIYSEADAVLFPVQWEEPWGLVPLEAMAMGRSVVATGTGGSAEYMRDGENCLIYEPRDSGAALASRIRELASNRALQAKLRGGGLETASRFTETAYNERIRDALELAADEHSPQARR